jgi:molybdate transport system regulatory protein
MGIGVLWLLGRIRTFSSVAAAARDMHLSYPKALRMLRSIEDGLGCRLVARRKGGAARGGAELTPEGLAFLAAYERFQRHVARSTAREFRKRFPDLAG